MNPITKTALNLSRAIREVTLPLTGYRQRDYAHPLSGREDGVIVSLTSFPARMSQLPLTLDSIMRQRALPDKIVLVLTQEEFPGGLECVPEPVRRMTDWGVEIVFLPYNLKCHNKYLYAVRRYPDAAVVTVDDDSLYARDTVSRLLDLHKKWPGAVCANRAARIDMGEHFGHYKSWERLHGPTGPSDLVVALGFAGVLYPPHCMDEGFFDEGLIRELSPTADDLWLKANEIRSGIPVVCGEYFCKPVTIKTAQKVSLRSVNKGAQNRNDSQWEALDGHFHLRERLGGDSV